MARYTDKNGGLVVDKIETTESTLVKKVNSEKKGSSISAANAIETMQSYQTGSFSVVDSSAKGVCSFCGKQTAFKNRYVCVDCWKEYKNEIIDGLKTAVKDVELKLD